MNINHNEQEHDMDLPTPPIDDEREAILAAVDSILNPFDATTSAQENLVLGAAQKWANRNRVPITDANGRRSGERE